MRFASVTRPPEPTTSFSTVSTLHASKVTSLVAIDPGSRVQLSQMPHVVILPPDAARASGLSHAAADSWVLFEKYCCQPNIG